jgi:lipopolysaccharide transport system ATP-binding protein
MSDIAVRAENLSKVYRIGKREGYHTLRDSIAQLFADSVRRLRNGRRETEGPISLTPLSRSATRNPEAGFTWALNDVSFEIKHGEVIGIIGRNGAGKSTLLKILSRITEPTEGEARIYGRVGSLLEVGTGFHPELTGRENLYLNGAILGMKKAEIDRKFDEIVSFAEVEKFLDTPVKHYSSGMYMRLAFSVAAHLEQEILIVDEVLAVGDAAFQTKCLGKMDSVAKEGRTVLFVSHNMAAVENLCRRALLLEDGRINIDGPVRTAIAEYIKSFSRTGTGHDLRHVKRDPGFQSVIWGIEFLDEDGHRITAATVGATLVVRIHYGHFEPLKDPYFGLRFETVSGVSVFWVQTRMQTSVLPDLLPASGVMECRIPRLSLVPGTYFVTPGCGSRSTQLDLVPRACQLQVMESDIFGTGRLPPQSLGLVVVDATWEAMAK